MLVPNYESRPTATGPKAGEGLTASQDTAEQQNQADLPLRVKGKRNTHLSPGTRSRSCAQGGQEPSVEPHSLSLRADHTAAHPYGWERPLPPSSAAAVSPAWAGPHPQRHRRVTVSSPLCIQQASQSPLEMRHHCPEPTQQKVPKGPEQRDRPREVPAGVSQPLSLQRPGTALRPCRASGRARNKETPDSVG